MDFGEIVLGVGLSTQPPEKQEAMNRVGPQGVFAPEDLTDWKESICENGFQMTFVNCSEPGLVWARFGGINDGYPETESICVLMGSQQLRGLAKAAAFLAELMEDDDKTMKGLSQNP